MGKNVLFGSWKKKSFFNRQGPRCTQQWSFASARARDSGVGDRLWSEERSPEEQLHTEPHKKDARAG